MVLNNRPDQKGEQVSINGNLFTLAAPVTQYTPDVETPAFSTSGAQGRSRNRKITPYVYDSWRKGIGHKRFRRQRNEDVDGLWFSTSNTIHHSAIYPGILNESQTHSAPADHIVRYATFKGDYWGLFEGDYTTTTGAQVAGVAKFGGTSDDWTGFSVPVVVASDETSTTAAGTTVTLSYTVSSGSDKLIVLAYSYDPGASFASGINWNVSGDEAFTLQENTSTGSALQGVWYLDNPTAGAGTLTASGFTDGNDRGVILIELKNAASGAAVDEQEDISTPFSVTHTAQAGDLLLGFGLSGSAAPTPTSPQIELQASAVGSANASGSYKYADGASPTTGASMSGTAIWTSIAIRGSGTPSAGAGLVALGTSARAFDMVAHKGRLFAVVTGGVDGVTEGAYQIRSSADGVTWENADNGSAVFPSATSYVSTTTSRQNNFNDDGARLLDFGNTLLCAIYEDPDASGGSVSQIRVFYSTNAATQGSETWVAGAVIPSGSGPKAFIAARDELTVGNPATPILITAEGIYRVDSGGTTFDLLLPLDGDPNNGRFAVRGQDGAIWCPLGSGPILRYDIIGQNSRLVEFVEPPEGLPTAAQGFCHFLSSPSTPYLIAAYGGDQASKQAGVYLIDYNPYLEAASGKRRWPWHCHYFESDANIDLHIVGYSTEDDATPRLHFGMENASSDEMYHLELPFTDPSSGVTMKFQADTYVDYPEEDFNDPHKDTAVSVAQVDADNLSADDTGDYIAFEYGQDGAAWNDNAEGEATFVGNFVSGDKTLFIGKTRQNETGQSEAGTPVGISAKTWRTRLHLKRDGGDNTDYVALKELQLEAVNKVSDIYGWQVPIDIDQTAVDQHTDVETIRGRINTIRQSVTSVAFLWGTGTTYYVEARPAGQAALEGRQPAGIGIGGQTERTAKGGIEVLVLEERIKTN